MQNVELKIYIQNKPIADFGSRQVILCLDTIRNAVRSFFDNPENLAEYSQWTASGEMAEWTNAPIAVELTTDRQKRFSVVGGGNGVGLAHAVPRCPNKPPTKAKRGHLTMSNAPYKTKDKTNLKGVNNGLL